MTDRVITPAIRPVPLPSEDRPTKSQRLAIWIAAMVLVGAAGGGLLYQQLWQEVSDDATRLLPASTSVYIDMHHPWHELTMTMKLDRWRDRGALELANHTQGLLADGLGGRLAGVPFTAVRRAAVAMERLRIASVPGARGTTWLIFIEIPDPWARQSVLSQLKPRLVTQERMLGHEIQSLKSDPRWLPWTERHEPLRFLELEPWLVVSIGPPDALYELLHSHVAGRSQPLRKRAGFPDEASPIRTKSNWSFVSPGAAYDALATTEWAKSADPVALRGLLLDLMRGLTLSGDVSDGDDLLSVRLELERSNLLAQLGHALAPVPDTLLRRLPDEADLAVALSIGSIDELLHIAEVFATSDLSSLKTLGLKPDLVSAGLTLALSSLRGVSEARPSEIFTGDILATHLPPPPGPVGAGTSRWVVALLVHDEERADAYLSQAIRALLGDNWTYGALYDDASSPPMHIIQQARLWSEPEGSATPPVRRFFWRVTSGLVVLAANEDLLSTFDASDSGPLVGPVQLARQRALRSLRRDSPLIILAHPGQLAAALDSPWAHILFKPLSPSFYTAATLDIGPSHLAMQANIGVWSSMVALTSTDRLTVDSLMLSDLSPECVRAYLALCASRAIGPICEAFQPGRKAALAEICGRLKP
jgi:hypothetical protein